ncbi:MAG: 23S rRNA (pseudouridine(1915)-N(3))-methyltransferase RlmH [Erysipelotrichaceae bacterium]|nr:23S rRNA (pseudouridine(1915)-N(3))-methyltransferase RlmH [Erysipelotrichaceae bacterium]
MIRILCVGKLKEKALQQLCDDYQKRLSHYSRIEIVQVSEEPEGQQAVALESARLSKAHKERAKLIVLDLKGEEIDSLKLAEKLQNWFSSGSPDLDFIIGGSNGVSNEILSQADWLWRLSPLTFTHGLVRVLLLEQLYRSYKISKNEPYHK